MTPPGRTVNVMREPFTMRIPGELVPLISAVAKEECRTFDEQARWLLTQGMHVYHEIMNTQRETQQEGTCRVIPFPMGRDNGA